MQDSDKQIHLELQYVMFRPHPIVKILDFITINFFVLIAGALIWGGFRLFNFQLPQMDYMLLILVAFSLIIMIESAMVVYFIVVWMNTYYLITPDTIAYNTGVLSNQRKVFVLRNVIEIDLSQDLMGKIFDYGTIRLEAHLIEETVFIRDIINPKRQINILNKIARSTQSQLPISADPRRGGVDRGR